MNVLVTGSSRGIGAAIAKRLATGGNSVFIHYTNNQDSAAKVASEIGDGCLGILKADLRDVDETRELWQKANEIAPVDTLVNNAGIYVPSPYSDDYAAWDQVRKETFRINFDAASELMHYAIADFLKSGEGKILNVASRVGFRGEAGASMYGASKAALINLTRGLAVELAEKNIQLMGIAPGWVDTAMARDGMNGRYEEIIASIPAGRMASPEDCAASAEFLLSRGAEYLTGVVIDINGASYFH
jgi:3-oxoacyl-[acyl-carrier protein] reductase